MTDLEGDLPTEEGIPALEATSLLPPELAAKLERMSLKVRAPFYGATKGEKRSKRKGAGIEFADFRDYAPGDDPRRVDWAAYARLERLYVRLFEEQEDLRVYLLLDGSRSMAFYGKFEHARRVAACLGFVALSGGDRLQAGVLRDGEVELLPPRHGRAFVFPLFEWLSGLGAEGGTGLSAALRRFASRAPALGLALVISDFLDPEGHETGLKALFGRGFEVATVHVMAREELSPPLRGDLTLVDAETGERREVTISASVMRRYREEAERFRRKLEGFVKSRGGRYLFTSPGDDLADLLLMRARREGLLGLSGGR